MSFGGCHVLDEEAARSIMTTASKISLVIVVAGVVCLWALSSPGRRATSDAGLPARSMAQAPEVAVFVAGQTFAQHEPIYVALLIDNGCDDPLQFVDSQTFQLEMQLADGSWRELWPDYGICGIGLVREVGASERQWWLNNPGAYADLEPGSYRFRPVALEFPDGRIVRSNTASFTVVAHPGNHSVAESAFDYCSHLWEPSEQEPAAVAALFDNVVASESVSDGLRSWVLLRLADYYFNSFNFVACRETASMIDPDLVALPCGGVAQVAEFFAIRADYMRSKTVAEWDLAYSRLDEFERRFPEFLAAHGYATYPIRRKFLPK